MPSFTINVNGENYTVGYDGTFDSPQGLLPALNNLGFGLFWIEQISGVNVLTTVDDNDVYGTASTNSDPTTTTTTTSTTLAPITWISNPSCAGSGIDGTGVITLSDFSGGSGTYLYAGIGDSEANAAIDVLNPATRTDIIGLIVSFTALPNGIYYTAVEDSVGGLHFSTQINVSCNNTTTTTSTTTTTTLAPTTSTTTTTTTAAPTTSTTTTSTTVAGPTTTSTTTTTTTLFAQTVNYASNATDACLNPTGTQNVTGNSTDFCTCTIFNSAGFVTLPDGNYVLAYSGNTININISGFPTTTATVTGGGCTTCPLSTSTTTTSTTLQQVWYQLTNCNGGGTVYTTNYDIGYAAVTDRVFGTVLGVPSTLVVSSVLFSDPSGTQIGIVNSGLTGCPSTSTTTTSTTLAVVTLSTTPSCTGIGLNGSGRIVADNFAGGSGTYEYAGIGDSEANAISTALNPATRVTISGSSVTFNSLVNDNYWVAIIDSLGNIGISAQTAISCNVTTTTTTTQPPYVYYVASRCDNIAFEQYFRTTGSYTAGESVRYNGYCWEIQSLTGTSGVDPESSYINCAACNGAFPTTTTSSTTTSTTLPPVTANISSVCTGLTQTITVDTFGGGSGTYFASTTTYASPELAVAGAVTSVSGSREYTSQPNGTRYVYVTSTGGAPVVKQGGQTCTTTTTTTQPPYTYYAATRCDNITFEEFFRTTGSYSAGESVRYNGYCWQIQSVQGTSGVDPESSYINCAACNGAFPTTTTTTSSSTTSSTTTTTTLAGVQFGVSITTKYATDFLACTGTVTGVVYQKAEFGNTPTVGAQLYTSASTGSGTEWTPSAGIGLYLMQFGGSTKWSVLVGNTGIINTVTSCVGVSTTTTTTTLPAIIVTATPSCDGSGFNGQGRVTANFSGGTGSYTWAALGTSEADAIACVNNSGCSQRFTVVGSSSFAWTSLSNGPYYVAVLDNNGSLGLSGLATVSCNATTTTTTTSSSTTSSTTTTTTLAPTNVWLTNSAAVSASAACANPDAQYVWTYGNAWGAGIVFYAGTALAPLQPIQPFLGGGFFYENGGQVINIDDNGVSSNLQACPSTTTTTAPPVYSYYIASRCDNPIFEQYFRTTGTYLVGLSVRYQGYCWEIQALEGTFGADAESTYLNCAGCNAANPTTTTTSTTSTSTTATPAACTTWTVSNFNGFGLGDVVDYTDCAGNPQSTPISDGNQFIICVLDSAFPPQMQFGYGSVTSDFTPCT